MKLWERQLYYTPGGGQTLSKLPSRYVNGMYPKMLSQGYGGLVFDVNGKEYIDYISGLGCISVGYTNQEINKAIESQLYRGISFSLPTILEADVAEELCRLMPEMEMWKYGKNGVDATLMAIRCARAYTGRSKILVHGYHGCIDHFESLGTRQAGMLDLSEYTKRFDFTYDYSDKSYAALIVEPIVFKELDWTEARKWCDATGTLLIFDEIVTGGRFPEFTAYKYLEVVPDLICIGKAIANGMPLSAVGGKQEIMKTFERGDFFASTTFGGECLSLAACLATIKVLKQHLGEMINYGLKLQEAFNTYFTPLAYCEGYPTRTQFVFPTANHKALFWQECVKQGVLFGYSNFPMAMHTKQDLKKTLEVMKTASEILKNYWDNPAAKLEGQAPVEVNRLTNR